jgi:alkanesulfonate monooxygenase SsuD/methylene tetrahydromethanopterin reductase-like flavin-dependent oxidoreductase (luciferase family)
VQRPGVPVWVAGFPGKRAPLRRAARYDGFFPVNLQHPDDVAAIAAELAELRDPDSPFDIAVGLAPGIDPRPYARAGATWSLVEFAPDALSVDEVRGVIGDGPAR